MDLGDDRDNDFGSSGDGRCEEQPTVASSSSSSSAAVVLHVVVVGFHHKKGCQVDYAYPPFQKGETIESTECPEEWKHLPSLALPDGSHNYEKDTIYFHMPSRGNPAKTVFGISCYRQMNAESLINRSSDITRGTVQKSVCIISTLPLYGLINAKLELITHAYFDERDFSKVSLLQETFRSLNSSLNDDLMHGQQVFLGLSVRDLVLQFKHKIVLLVKLVLLERKVLFIKSPVKDLCVTILSLLSLFPGMIEYGLEKSVELSTSNEKDGEKGIELVTCLSSNEDVPLSMVDLEFTKHRYDESISENKHKDEELNLTEGENVYGSLNCDLGVNKCDEDDEIVKKSNVIAESRLCFLDNETNPSDMEKFSDIEGRSLLDLEDLSDCDGKEKVDLTKLKLEFRDRDNDMADDTTSEKDSNSYKGSKSSLASKESVSSIDGQSRIASIKGKVMGAISYWSSRDKTNDAVETVMKEEASEHSDDIVDAESKDSSTSELDESDVYINVGEEKKTPLLTEVINLDLNSCGLPLQIFGQGILCHPYLSLPFLDLLKDSCVQGFIAGATNVLFKQKKHLVDVIVEVDDGNIEIFDNDLRKQLHLTTEDLRFADYLVKNVTEGSSDIFLDGTGWEGGDEWLRAQFKLYIICLLRTSMLQNGCREIETFNQFFLMAWKETRNYNSWNDAPHLSVLEINPGHPFQGQLSMADMKLRINHTMQNSERGRKINQAVVNTGKAVAQTSKVFGGAISQAKSAVSSWLHVFSAPPTPELND